MSRLETYSQFGEDREIVAHFPERYLGYFVEVGANNGVRDSNTLLLEKCGWSGILIEANAELADEASRMRPNARVVQTVVGSGKQSVVRFLTVSKPGSNLDGLSSVALSPEVMKQIEDCGGAINSSEIPCRCLDDILSENLSRRQKVDFVSIDVEGAEMDVLRGFNLTFYLPRLVMIEDNSKGADVNVPHYMKSQGYARVHRTGWNDWYVPRIERSGFSFRSVVLQFRLLKWAVERSVKNALPR